MFFPFLLLLICCRVNAIDGLPPRSAAQSRLFATEHLKSQAEMLRTTTLEWVSPEFEIEYEDTSSQELRGEIGYSLGSRRRARILNRKNQIQGKENSLHFQILEVQTLARLRELWIDLYTSQLELREMQDYYSVVSEILKKISKQAQSGWGAPLDAKRLMVKKTLIGTSLQGLRNQVTKSRILYSEALGQEIPKDMGLVLPKTLELGNWGKIPSLGGLQKSVLELFGEQKELEKGLLKQETGFNPSISFGLIKEKSIRPDPMFRLGFVLPDKNKEDMGLKAIQIETQIQSLKSQQASFVESLMVGELEKMYTETHKFTLNEVIPAAQKAKEIALETQKAWVSGQMSLTDWLDSLEVWEEMIGAKASQIRETLNLEIQWVLWKGKL